MPLKRSTMLRTLAATAAIALTTTGCLSSGDDGGGGSGGGDSGDGEIEVLGAFTGPEQDAFEASIKDWEEENDIDVKYTGNSDFTTLINTKVSSGDTPDIGLFPQPGLVLDIAAKGEFTPVDEYLDVDTLESTLIPGFLDAATDADGTVWGAPMRMAVKSLVWVPKGPWEDAGYTTDPASVQEIEDLAQEVKSGGTAPWCMGWESGAATGWVGTDWIEEFVLRLSGPEVYDQWTSHEIPFDDPQIKAAFDAYQQLMGDDEDNVFGGSDAILNTSFQTTGNDMLTDPPKCMMMRQGNFITGFFPEAARADLDGTFDVLPFPAYEGGYDGTPVLGGGDIAALFNGDDDDATAFMEFLTSDQFGAQWAQAGGWLSPHTTFDASNYPDETTRAIAEVATSADVFRYDGSDLMPAEVGADSFWKGMVAWVSGEKTTDEVLAEIEASWPQ